MSRLLEYVEKLFSGTSVLVEELPDGSVTADASGAFPSLEAFYAAPEWLVLVITKERRIYRDRVVMAKKVVEST